MKEVLEVTTLRRDLECLPSGLETLIGERGINLSGGQRARVSLARALYSNADIYLLDDPLSAVDAKVSKQIFQQAIKTFLKDKCVILATHRIEYTSQFSRVFYLKDKKVIERLDHQYVDDVHTNSNSIGAEELPVFENAQLDLPD